MSWNSTPHHITRLKSIKVSGLNPMDRKRALKLLILLVRNYGIIKARKWSNGSVQRAWIKK